MLVIMRLIHVVAGVAWAGGSFMITGFVEPTVRALGPDGGKFMQHVTGPGRLTTYMTSGAILNTLSGLYLYWVHSGGFKAGWITSGDGLALTIGGAAGLIASIYGMVATGRIAARVGELGQEMQSAAGPPKPEQLAEMGALQSQLRQSGRIGTLLLIIAVIGMSVVGYV